MPSLRPHCEPAPISSFHKYSLALRKIRLRPFFFFLGAHRLSHEVMQMKIAAKKRGGARRLGALGLAVGTLWAVAVTSESDTILSAVSALRRETSAPLTALRWELGDLGVEDGLSPAAVLTIAESPLLLSARETVAQLLSTETPDTPQQPVEQTPVEETPLDASPVPTEDIPENGVPAKTLTPTGAAGYTVSGKVYISNSTDYDLPVQSLTESFDAGLTGEEPQILIIHTHGSEAYTPAPGVELAYSGNHRTTDTRYNVVAVGDAMAREFGELGISVLHDRTLYDYPSYSGAYDRSLKAIESNLAQYPSIHFVLDVHRDAIEDTEGNEYKVISPISGVGNAAQVTIVVGSDGSGLTHPHWMENLKLAVGIQQDLTQLYPTLLRPILLRNSRYNQHATTGSLLLEMGAAGNSPEEAALAGRLFARQMGGYLLEKSK